MGFVFMKKLNYIVYFLIVSTALVDVCLSMDHGKTLELQPAASSEYLEGLRQLSIGNVGQRPLSGVSDGDDTSFGVPSRTLGSPDTSVPTSPLVEKAASAAIVSSMAASLEVSTPLGGRVVTPCDFGAWNRLRQVLRRGNTSPIVLPWQKEVVNIIAREYPGFECVISDNGEMTVAGDFKVGKDSWKVYTMRGQEVACPIGLSRAIKEEKVGWAPKIVITPAVQSGMYNISITTPEPEYFQHANAARVPSSRYKIVKGIKYYEIKREVRLQSGKIYEYESVADLSRFLSSVDIRSLNPCNAVYGE